MGFMVVLLCLWSLFGKGPALKESGKGSGAYQWQEGWEISGLEGKFKGKTVASPSVLIVTGAVRVGALSYIW
jgi:hypothetical protein